jgi:hypothetical protein
MKKIMIYGSLPFIVIVLIVTSVIIWHSRNNEEPIIVEIDNSEVLHLLEELLLLDSESITEHISPDFIMDNNDEVERQDESDYYNNDEDYEYIEGYIPTDDELGYEEDFATYDGIDYFDGEEWVEPEPVG